MEDISVPAFYVVDRNSDISSILSFVHITPPYCTIICDMTDLDLANELGYEIVRVNTMSEAKLTAELINKETNRCPIIIDNKYETIYAKEESKV